MQNRVPELSLAQDQQDRDRRIIDVVGLGETGQRRLVNSSVLVVVAGGLGPKVIVLIPPGSDGVIAGGNVVETPNPQRTVIPLQRPGGRGQMRSLPAPRAKWNTDVSVDVMPAMLPAVLSHRPVAYNRPGNRLLRHLRREVHGVGRLAAAGAALVGGSAVGMQGQVSVFGMPNADGRPLWLRDLFRAKPAPAGIRWPSRGWCWAPWCRRSGP